MTDPTADLMSQPAATERAGISGFVHPGYARALVEFGVPTVLPRSGGALLLRAIPGSPWFDGMAPYPHLACSDWSSLAADFEEIADELVSVCAALDPFGNFRLEDLRCAFPDHLVHFKHHFVADLSIPADRFISREHARQARKALRTVQVEVCTTPLRYLDEWTDLFGEAVRRFRLTGIRAFSRESFAKQFALPGARMTLAREADRVIAAHVQMLQSEVAYAHLAAASPRARAVGADFALYFEEIRYFADHVRWIDWGGDAGVESGGGALSRFKSGWSTGTRPAYFAGRIGNPHRYRALTAATSGAPGTYFPAYRAGEFALPRRNP